MRQAVGICNMCTHKTAGMHQKYEKTDTGPHVTLAEDRQANKPETHRLIDTVTPLPCKACIHALQL